MNLYIAQVVDNDSQNHEDGNKDGRVKIYIPELHYGFAKNQYPWAQQDRELSSFIPEKDDLVWVYFLDEPLFKKPYYGNKVQLLNKNDHGITIGSIKATYPNVKYIRLPNGVSIGLSSVTEEISIFSGSSEIFFNDNGDITITAKEDLNLECTGDINLVVGVGKAINVSNSTISFNLLTHKHGTGVGPSSPPLPGS
jgi:hypothetical protein